MRRRRLVAWVLSTAWIVGVTAVARGETDSSGSRPKPSLTRRFGAEHLAELLKSGTLAGRLRGITRLSGLATERALDRLTTFALEHRGELSAKEWLTLARGLAPHATRGNAELVLATLMNQRPSPDASSDELALFELARSAAALALADGGRSSALATLGRALRTGGSGAALAAQALMAHPPAELGPLLDVPGEPSVELARLLGTLGDERAFHPLRAWVRGQSAEVRAASALALLELGHMETVPLARQWIDHPMPVLRQAALRILMAARDPEATRALVSQLEQGPSDPELLRLALSFPSPELASVAERQLDALGSRDADASVWWTLLGRAGAVGISRLEAGLRDPDAAFAAAHALSRSAEPAAAAALERALSNGVARELVVCALAARAWALGERSEALHAQLTELTRSKAFGDRRLGAFGLSLEGPEAALAELQSGDEARILGAASNALAFDESVLGRAAALLESAPPGRVRTALSVVLLRRSGRQAVTSTLLRSLVSEESAARPLALRALASRGGDEVGSLVRRYADHADPVLRAHVARGLGESTSKGAVGLLARRFEFEIDSSVRLAIVCALGEHGGSAAERTLSLAAQLDADAGVRSAARLARLGNPIGDPPPRGEILWAELRSAAHVRTATNDVGGSAPRGAARREPAAAVALVNVAPGLAFPVFVGAEGLLIVAGVGLRTLGIRLL